MKFEIIRQIPPLPDYAYAGMTEALIEGRMIQAYGPPKDAEAALRRWRPTC